jgi:hypothetical protein
VAIDRKYGRVTFEKPNTIGEDEPVIVFRAQDKLLIPLLVEYLRLCAAKGSPDKHLDLIIDSMGTVEEWQRSNPTKTPESAGHVRRDSTGGEVQEPPHGTP